MFQIADVLALRSFGNDFAVDKVMILRQEVWAIGMEHEEFTSAGT